jgi:hypothetical protein
MARLLTAAAAAVAALVAVAVADASHDGLAARVAPTICTLYVNQTPPQAFFAFGAISDGSGAVTPIIPNLSPMNEVENGVTAGAEQVRSAPVVDAWRPRPAPITTLLHAFARWRRACSTATTSPAPPTPFWR